MNQKQAVSQNCSALAGVVLPALAALVLALSSCTTGTSAQAAERATPYGVVAAPPLPLSAPAAGLDPATEIADVDGSVVARLVNNELHFVSGHGEPIATILVDARAELRAVSANGTRAALFQSAGNDSSAITVVTLGSGTATTIRSEDYVLKGVVEPEAFSTDGTLLYVIDHEVAAGVGAYRVRPLNLETGQLETIVGPAKVPLIQDMNGVGRQQVWSPGGSRLNTLYIRQTHHHHGPEENGPEENPTHGHGPGTDGFVHILDLDEEWAFCLDLPEDFGAGDLATTALAISPDGRTLAVADLNAGQIAFGSASELAVTSVFALPDFAVDEELHLGLANDALILGSGRTAQWFQPQGFQPQGFQAQGFQPQGFQAQGFQADTLLPLGQPIELSRDLIGFTPAGDQVLAWLSGSNGPPTSLYVPER